MICDNYNHIINKVNTAAINSNRTPSDITVIGVTKTVDTDRIMELYTLGLKVFGENKVQELLPKIEALPKDICWHFIGRLQSNKVKQIVGKVFLIQSVDSIKLLNEIEKCAKKLDIVQNILLEINIGNEESKGGISICDLNDIISYTKNLQNVKVLGLMCIPPNTSDNALNVDNLNKMRKVFVDNLANCSHNIHMDILSMGMSLDYEDAILAGSNMVRIGQAFFGER